MVRAKVSCAAMDHACTARHGVHMAWHGMAWREAAADAARVHSKAANAARVASSHLTHPPFWLCPQADAHKIHYLMIVLVAFKSLTVLSQVRNGGSVWGSCVLAAAAGRLHCHCLLDWDAAHALAHTVPCHIPVYRATPCDCHVLPWRLVLLLATPVQTLMCPAMSPPLWPPCNPHACSCAPSLPCLSVRQAFMYHTISVSGDAEGWNIAFYVFTGCRSLLFFVVIILLATGEGLPTLGCCADAHAWGWHGLGRCRCLLLFAAITMLATGGWAEGCETCTHGTLAHWGMHGTAVKLVNERWPF